MRRVKSHIAGLMFLGFAVFGTAEVFEFYNGNSLEGEVSVLDETGLVVRLESGGFSDRQELVYLTQETLNRLARNREYVPYIRPFLDLPEENPHPPVIHVREVERLALSDRGGSLFAALKSPLGLLFLVVFYAANLIAAFEISVYRGYPKAMVCGIALIIPGITPLVFLLLPPAKGSYAEDYQEAEEPMAEYPEELEPAPPPPPELAAPSTPGVPQAGRPKLGLQQAAATKTSDVAASAVYTRNDTTFNRNFFETTFGEFFRVVPSPAVKDMVLVFKGVKKEAVAKRITRISANEIRVQLVANNKELPLTFGELVQVTLRHKDAT